MIRLIAMLVGVVCGLVCYGSPAFAQTPIEVSVSLNRDTIGMDEEAVMEVKVSGTVRDLPQPQLPRMPMFEVYSQGQSSNISIVNGQVESSVTYRYLIMPQKAGTFPLGTVSVVYQNKRYKGEPVTLTVLSKGTAVNPELEEQARDDTGDSRDQFLEASVDKANPYVNEQVTLTLKYYIGVRYYGSPELTEPTTTGFWTEVLGNKSPYRQRIGNRTYKVIERKYALFPTQTGELTIGRSIITATVAGSSRSQRDPFDVFGVFGSGEEVRVYSDPIKVRVKPLPEEGRPDGFTGTIGRFEISATSDKTTAELNQPVTVKIDIKGFGNIKSVAEPTIPELDDFRVYRASSNESMAKVDDKIGGTKTFEEVFIPNRPGQLEIPSLSFSFFNPERGRYQTVRTRPIKLTVIKPEGYQATEGMPYAAPSMTIGSEARDIRYIKDNIGDLQHRGQLLSSRVLYVVVNALSVLLLAGTVGVRLRREKLSADVGYARSRMASKQAHKRLARARKLAMPETAGDFYAESSQAVISFVADKLNVSPHGLTIDKLTQLLAERGVDEKTLDDLADFLNQCDYARYAPGSSDQGQIDQALTRAEDLMVRMEGVKF